MIVTLMSHKKVTKELKVSNLISTINRRWWDTRCLMIEYGMAVKTQLI